MSRRLQQHAAHCTCSECTSRSLNGQSIRPHAPEPEPPPPEPPPPTVEVSGVEIPLADFEETECAVERDFECPDGARCVRPDCNGSHGDYELEGDEDIEDVDDIGDDDADNGPHSGAV